MEIVGAVIQFLQCASSPITECWKNHRDLEENMNKLIKQELVALNSRRTDIESRRETECRQGETKLKADVEHWLRRVTEIDVEIHNLEENFQNVKCLCRASLGEKVIKKIMQVEDLYRAGEFPNGLVIPIEQHGEIMPTTSIVGGETTFKRKMEEIWAGLMDDEVTKIGVYGMGGIGKTTAMEYLNNRLIQNKEKFDDVFWITMSKESDIISLQLKIAKKLGLKDIEHDDETARGSKIYAEFKRKKRFVLILDDLWDSYSLKNVGIPEPTLENGCKLVLTTRSYEVCREMDCKPVPINLFSKEEALELFLKIVGPETLSIPNMEPIVKDIVNECAGLPLAIATIAGSLKSKTNCDEMEIALEDLRKSTKGSEGILKTLKFSYDRLNDKQLQDCLLYCALFPEDHPIEREMLIQLLIVEGIIEERDSRQSQCKKGTLLLNTLVRVCLLNDASDYQGRECLKMHDLVRDMAIEITKGNPHFFVKAGINLKSIPKEQDWKEDFEKVSLMYNKISNIPSSESPKCPKLSTLLLCGNSFWEGIHSNFFLNMEGLNILNLSGTRIEMLPDSISNLVKLTALLLKECFRLSYVPSLAKLTALRELDFYRSGITEAPQGMEMLVKLRYLNFDECEIETIPDGVLCRLINLEYLFFNRKKTKVKGEELAYLKNLKNFEGRFCDGHSFEAYIGSLDDEGLANYILQLGYTPQWEPVHWGSLDQSVFNKRVHLYEIQTDDGWSLLLPKDVQSLSIFDSCFNGRSLCELPFFSNVTNLRSCYIKGCSGISNLLSYPSNTISLLQSLEKLDLEDVTDLQVLIRIEKEASSLLPPGTFSSVKEIRLDGCDKIKKLFMITSLPNLEWIIVVRCDQLVEIVSTTNDGDQNEEEGTDDTITLPKLKRLDMGMLPKLRSFCSSKKPVIADSLETVHIILCPKLKRLSLLDREPCPPPSLEKIYINNDEWESLEWDHPNAKALLQPLRQDFDMSLALF
ncbi:hypothetical protein UlMin_003217 [Ulmus minor]